MYYFEKDYIMRLIHGISRILARMLFNRDLDEPGDILSVMDSGTRESSDYLSRLIDEGKINEAEDKLFEMIRTSAWERQQLSALILAFYDRVNDKDDEFLSNAGFPRNEISAGMEDALNEIGVEVPEYLKI